MAIYNCKMCGGTLEIQHGSSVAICEYCGTEQTIPNTDDDQLINMLNRANHYRQIFEFDKALEIYEKVLARNANDPEIYWSIVLCRYGIEYVDDPLSNKKIPTCHRTQYASILENADYLEALNHADVLQRTLLQKEAEYIDKIQKGILEISIKEKPFDVFICYKETSEDGQRTNDSIIAQEIYYQLTDKGYKVFFSRITLEDKLGQQYEPYIFAALNSSQVMVVVGTKPEYFNSVWVKNEWNRYLSLMQTQKNKMIIPAYRDMDPYDLPDALSYYQAQDMSKIGFIQDLIRGIDKVLKADGNLKRNEGTGYSDEANASIKALLKRGELSLEDEEWDKAYDFFDQVLNLDAESSSAYLGQLLAKNHACNIDDLVLSRLSQSEAAIEYEHYLKCDERIIAQLNKIISDNALNYTISLNDLRYTTISESRRNQIEKEQKFFMNDKLLIKAIRFSDSSLRSLIEEKKSHILTVMRERLTDAEEYDSAVVSTIENQMKEICDQETKKVYNIKELTETIRKEIEEIDREIEKKITENKINLQEQQKAARLYDEEKRPYHEEIEHIEKNIRDTIEMVRIYTRQLNSLGAFKSKQKRQLESKISEDRDYIDELENRKVELKRIINGKIDVDAAKLLRELKEKSDTIYTEIENLKMKRKELIERINFN